MRTLFIVLLTSLFVISSAVTSAQEQESWPVEQHCIGDLTYPIVQQGNWDFPGVIISGYGNGSAFRDSGIRAARADIDADYWLAMASAHSYPFSGALSPDNRYFAYPIGHTTFEVNSSGSELVGVDDIRIVRTDGDTSETYLFAGNDIAFVFSLDNMPDLQPVKWLSPDEAYYPNPGNSNGVRLYDYTQEGYVPWTHDKNPDTLEFTSPDLSRAFAFDRELGEYGDPASYRLYDLDSEQQLDYPMPRKAVWFADSDSFLSTTESGLAIIDRDGQQVDFITEEVVLSLALATNQQVFAFWNEDQQLFIGKLNERVIYDMCFETTQYFYSWHLGPNLAFSPDDSQLAFSYDGYLVILDLETLENQIIDTPSDWVMGWATLEGETFETTIPAFDWPTTTPTPVPTSTLVPSATPEPTVTILPTATLDPAAITCQLDVVVGANLRPGPGADNEHVGSAAEGFVLYAQAQQFNEAEYFIWWQLNTGEWIREDFVREGENCEFLPPPEAEEAP